MSQQAETLRSVGSRAAARPAWCAWALVVLAALGVGVSSYLVWVHYSGALYSAYLTYLELFVIGALCPWCVSSAVLVAAICALAAWGLVAASGDEALPGEHHAHD